MRSKSAFTPLDMAPRAAGFTLIELLMVVSLVAMIGMAIYGQFSSGVKVIEKITQPNADEDINIFFEKLSRDLQNAFLYSEIPFEGDKSRFSFASIVRADPKLGGDEAIGRVSYFYDSSKKALSRRQENVSQVKQSKEGDSTPLLNHALSLSIQYYKYEPSESNYLWKEEWAAEPDKKALPIAVRLEFEFEDAHGNRQRLTKTVSVPVGSPA